MEGGVLVVVKLILCRNDSLLHHVDKVTWPMHGMSFEVKSEHFLCVSNELWFGIGLRVDASFGVESSTYHFKAMH